MPGLNPDHQGFLRLIPFITYISHTFGLSMLISPGNARRKRESGLKRGIHSKLSICSGDVGPLLIDLIFDTQI